MSTLTANSQILNSNNISNRLNHLQNFLNRLFSYESIRNCQDRYIHSLIRYWATPNSTAIPLCALLKHPELKDYTVEDIIKVSDQLIHIALDLERSTIIIQLRLERCTLILRDIPENFTSFDILAILSNCPELNVGLSSVMPGHDINLPDVCPQIKEIYQKQLVYQSLWFITLANSELAFQAAVFLQQHQLNNMPIRVRIKNEMLLNIKELIESITPQLYFTHRRNKTKSNSPQKHDKSYSEDKGSLKHNCKILNNEEFTKNINHFQNTISKRKKYTKKNFSQNNKNTSNNKNNTDELKYLTDHLLLLETNKSFPSRLRKKNILTQEKKSPGKNISNKSETTETQLNSSELTTEDQIPTDICTFRGQSEKSDNRSTADSMDDLEENIHKKENTHCVILSSSDTHFDVSLLNCIRFGEIPSQAG